MAVTQNTQRNRNKILRPTKMGHGKKGPTKLSKKSISPPDQRIQVQNRIRSTFTGTRLFDRSLHKTNIWLKELMEIMNWNNRERSLSALRATLHALREILPLQEVPHLGAQFPILIRGLYYENWHISSQPLKLNSIEEFYELVREKLGQGAGKFSNDELRQLSRACLFVITKHVSKGEMYDIKGALRRNLRDLIDISFDELKQQSGNVAKVRNTPRRAKKMLEHAMEKRQRKTEVSGSIRHGSLH